MSYAARSESCGCCGRRFTLCGHSGRHGSRRSTARASSKLNSAHAHEQPSVKIFAAGPILTPLPTIGAPAGTSARWACIETRTAAVEARLRERKERRGTIRCGKIVFYSSTVSEDIVVAGDVHVAGNVRTTQRCRHGRESHTATAIPCGCDGILLGFQSCLELSETVVLLHVLRHPSISLFELHISHPTVICGVDKQL
eukprot:SAG31_NODE_3960_length_3717_cov_10.714483_2_plen_198_part_00